MSSRLQAITLAVLCLQILLNTISVKSLPMSSMEDGADKESSKSKENETELKETNGRLKRDHGSNKADHIMSTVNRHIWPNKRVPFRFDPQLSESIRAIVREAMDIWSSSVCIRFEMARREDEDYIMIKQGTVTNGKIDTCSSQTGRRGGEQIVNIASHCSNVGHALHEIGHAIGLYHEHNRFDRDDYIEILQNYERIYSNEFEIVGKWLLQIIPDVGYDIQSIMHYNAYAFSRDGNSMTIKLREDADLEELNCTNRLPMGQRIELSYKDKLRANLLYSCDANITEPECILPTPTPTIPPTVTSIPTTESITVTTMPTPSITQPSITPSPLSNRLRSGNVIALTFSKGNYGIECSPSPGCTPIPCSNIAGNSCAYEDSQFEIIGANSSTATRIQSGNMVLLKAVGSLSSWLDCSNTGARCTISTCKENILDEDYNNSSYVSNCANHQFQIFGYSRRGALKKNLSSNHNLQFKGLQSDGYLNCNGKRCVLLENGVCQSRPLDVKTACSLQNFSVLKLREIL